MTPTQLDDGHVKVVDMNAKPSSTILKEVMSIAGGNPWKTQDAGTLIVPGELLDESTTTSQ